MTTHHSQKLSDLILQQLYDHVWKPTVLKYF